MEAAVQQRHRLLVEQFLFSVGQLAKASAHRVSKRAGISLYLNDYKALSRVELLFTLTPLRDCPFSAKLRSPGQKELAPFALAPDSTVHLLKRCPRRLFRPIIDGSHLGPVSAMLVRLRRFLVARYQVLWGWVTRDSV